MTNFKPLLFAAAAFAPAAMLAPVVAQTASVAVIEPASAILGAKAIGPAWKQIGDNNAAAFNTARQREQTLETAMKPLRDRIDTNRDGRIDQAELSAAEAAKKPELQQMLSLQQAAQGDIARALGPVQLAQAWVIDQARLKYRPALTSVANAKKIGAVVTSDSVTYVSPTADITDDVTAAINASFPTATIAPPANWQPSQETASLFQQFSAALANAAARAQSQQPRPATGTAPATTTPRPAASPTPTGR